MTLLGWIFAILAFVSAYNGLISTTFISLLMMFMQVLQQQQQERL